MANNVLPDPLNVNMVSPDPLPVDLVSSITVDVNVVSPDPLPVEMVKPILPTTAYGELSVAEPTPVAQITAQYGFTGSIFTASIGGTFTEADSMFHANTGTGANNVTAISSNTQVPYKSGQGLTASFSAIFDTPVANNTQAAGFINSESIIGFGVKDSVFGIIFASGGALEIQELTITTGAVGSENATVTIDGNPYTVPLTNIGINGNAYEVALSLNSQVAGFDFASNEDTVECMALLPELGGGAFTFLSASAVGAFVEQEASNLATETLIPKSSWNVNPDIDIDPLMGNIYKVQYRYLGFGNISFFVGDPDSSDYELVHVLKYANLNTTPSVKNPIFRVGWASRNTGNTTNVTVSGGSAGIFVEGKYEIHGKPDGECHIQTVASGSIRNILSVRNRMVFNNKPNRASLFLEDLSVATESTKITTFFIYLNATTSGQFTWVYEDDTKGIAEIATDNTIITGGDRVACYSVRTELLTNLQKVIENLKPLESVTVAAIISGSASDVSASISFIEDL